MPPALLREQELLSAPDPAIDHARVSSQLLPWTQLLRGVIRTMLLVAVLAFHLCSTACLYLLPGRSLAARVRWSHRLARLLLRLLRIELRVQGTVPVQGLIVSNHLSYLDVLAYLAAMPCVFVSKSEVRAWPLFGACASVAGTVFVDRSSRHSAARTALKMRAVLAAGLPVVLFPEGTSSNGKTVLPFFPTLFSPAVAGRSGAVAGAASPLSAAAIAYSREDTICYYGDHSFAPHLVRALAVQGVQAAVWFGEPIAQPATRKAAAAAGWLAVQALRQAARTH